MENLDYMSAAEETMPQIKKGAFLTVKAGDDLNVMTIGWATIGYVWRKPIFMIAVRDSRHTFGLLEKAADFTVSVPSEGMKDEVMFCGTKSGKDVDKFTHCRLETVDALAVSTPVIDVPGIHYECRIIFKSVMDPVFLEKDLEKLYPEKDYHTLYFGQIVSCYRK